MDPYQRTAQEMKRQSEGPKRFAKQAVGAAAAVGASSFSPMLARIAPFLSEYIPQDLAIKGLSKIHPKFGEFVKTAFDKGYDFGEVKDFLGEQVKESQGQGEEEPAKQNGNVIEQYSPNLFQYMKDLIGQGSSPLDAAAKARKFLDKKEQDIISKMEKDHKTDWSSIVESVFGGQGMAQAQTQQQQPQQPGPQGQPKQGGQQGSGSQKLMQILGMINQKLGQ